MNTLEELSEQIGSILKHFHRSSCYPDAMDIEIESTTDDIMDLVNLYIRNDKFNSLPLEEQLKKHAEASELVGIQKMESSHGIIFKLKS